MISTLLAVMAQLVTTIYPITGPARTHDGDTIVIGTTHIRLQGVDAEELTEPNGFKARDEMRAIIGSKTITCYPEGKSYDRVVATCFTQDGTDIGAELIRRGMALDCARYSHGKYRAYEPVGARQRLIQKAYCVP